MSTKLLNRVKQFNKTARSHSLKTYWKLLRLYCIQHPSNLPSDILDVVRRRDIHHLLGLADSLRGTVYASPQQHIVANQFSELIRKYPFKDPYLDPEKTAYETFCKSEKRCARFNRLVTLRRMYGRNKHEYFFQKVRDFIAYVIGNAPPTNWLERSGFGPGASVGVHGVATHPGRKLSSVWTCTPTAAHYFVAAARANLFMRYSLWPTHGGFAPGNSPSLDQTLTGLLKSGRLEIVSYNKLEFVPKTAKTHRSIAIEPLGNGFLQKGIDNTMRLFLKRIGLDLSKQEPNSHMARLGSMSPEHPFATIDLSSASDSISIELVREVLPPEWFSLLNSLRSPNFKYKDIESKYEKFSSMGNGFCFPLQTLIFAAVANACGCGRPGKDFRVYGDDIIVPTDRASQVIVWLRRFGFKINGDKTYVSGLFRESCGGDWFDGQDVRPYIFDKPLESLQDFFNFSNTIKRNPLWDKHLWPLREYVEAMIPEHLRLYRPFQGATDTALDSDGTQHLTSPYCRYLRDGVWRWSELQSSARADPAFRRVESLEFPLQMYNVHNRGQFVLRRTTSTRLRLTTGAGATSQWCPTDLVKDP